MTAQYLRVGLHSYQHHPVAMPAPHRHNELEFIYLHSGSVAYAFGPSRLALPSHRLLVFWAGLPHQVLESSGDARISGLELPLAWMLNWRLPERLSAPLFQGHVLCEAGPQRGAADAALMARWHEGVSKGSPAARQAALLEAQARLWRLSISFRPLPVRQPADLGRLEAISRFVVDNYRRPIRATDVSRQLGLHANYAMKIFHKGLGIRFGEYVNQLRVAHAQCLLSGSDSKITEVAAESGFQSLSRFNANFRRECGLSPRAYRQLGGLV